MVDYYEKYLKYSMQRDLSYNDKYLKYKMKYLELKQSNMIQTGGKNDIDIFEEIEIYNEVLKKSNKLKNHYYEFWKNIYNNDAYIYHKISIEYYKNVYNNKFRSFFSSVINKKLFTGSCQYIDIKNRKDFIDDNSKVDIDDLCNLSTSVINNLDNVFYICPKLPNDTVCFRGEIRGLNDEILNLQIGDYYNNNGYMSTSINPILYFSRLPPKEEKLGVVFTIFLPKDSLCYYMNVPFGIKKMKDTKLSYGFQEYEILLPRRNIFKITNIRKIKNIILIEMYLIHQNKTQEIINETEQKVPLQIMKKSEYKKLEKDNLIVFSNKMKPDFGNLKNIKLDILNSFRKLWKETPFKLKNLYVLLDIKNSDLYQWLVKKPKYDNIKYGSIKKEDFEEIYNNFIESQKYYKKIDKFYIQIEILYNHDNLLYEQFMNIKNNKIYKFDKPLIIYKKLSKDMIFPPNMICYKEDGMYKEDPKYPVTIIIEVSKTIKYLPQFGDFNFSYDLEQIKIQSFDKIELFDNFYIIMAKAK
jgi:hypothetical protein